MIRLFLLASIATLLLTTGAHAQCSCSTNQVTNGVTGGSPNLSTALSGNTVCVAKAGGGWENQEYHQSGPTSGNIVDFKKGPTDPIDPTKTIGIWTISGSGASTQVTYSYASGSTGVYFVCSAATTPGPGDAIGFCPSANGSSTINATLKAGQGACP